ncbi:MAG: alpha-amylase family glycosyl hydrolase, partial [Acidobacteria bacterium]|nr:alpha-amylase family glycosyl hydrolase [Acidobacteriota bacterium]
MIKEFIFVASHRDIQVVHIGIFPSLGRYFRKQMTYRGGGIFRTEIEIPRGEVYYHYFLNEDFNHPQGNILEELAAKDDPLNRSSLFLGTKPFCALEFNTGPQYLSRDSQGNLTLRAITHYTHIESLVLIMDETEEIPFFPLFRFQNETYWWLKFPIRERMDTFAIKLKIRRGEIILYRDAFPDTAMMKAEINKRTISPASVGYQVFPDRFFKSKKQEDRDFFLPWGAPPKLFSYFGGDIPGISKKLPYLKALGINFIYLNPIFYSGSSHRYDTIDYYQVDPLLGSSDEFKELVEKAHSLKIGIILDLALNHCGVDFFAFKDVLENQELSRYRNWFSINRYPVQVNEKPAYDCYQGHTHMPEFNLENPEVREYLRRAVLYWLKNYDIDGFRIDTCASIKLDFLQELVKNIREI